jgi:3-hydroxyisobutyrate dehydrogenase-like beta-hydroxyacid dehydrogenase
MATVAIVGTGRMGSAFAQAQRAAGHEVILQNRTRARADEVAGELGAGVGVVDTPAEAAASADVVLSMLADDDAVQEAWAGPRGLIEGAHPGVVLVDSSTVRPSTLQSLEADVRGRGAGILDAPVSGSTAFARTGQLTVMVGGTAEDLDRARPALDAIAKTIVHVGPLGSGAAMKLAVNTVIYGLNGAVAEGLVLAEAAGIDRETAYDVIANSAVGAPYLGYKRAAFLDPATAPVAFALDLAEKDLRLIEELAASLGVPVPQARTNHEIIRGATDDGGGGRDFSAVAEELRSRRARAGV